MEQALWNSKEYSRSRKENRGNDSIDQHSQQADNLAMACRAKTDRG